MMKVWRMLLAYFFQIRDRHKANTAMLTNADING